jgi:hydrogenase maturation protease
MGNVLRRDDGFGVELAQRLQREAWPENVRVLEAGIGGISVVQELLSGYDALILLDAIDRGGEPGTVYVLEPQIDDIGTDELTARQDFLADIHYATPERVLVLAQALGVLPRQVRVVAGQIADAEDLGTELSPAVTRALDQAAETVNRLLSTFLTTPQSP